MSFRDKLIKLRTEGKMSQQELADRLDVSRQTVSRWEAGKNIPSTSQLANICKVFNIQANDLMDTPPTESSPTDTHSEVAPTATPHGGTKPRAWLFAVMGVVMLIAVAGLVMTIVYAVKDSVYDTSATVWIAAIPQNTPFIILSVFIAIFIAVLAAIFILLLRGKKK